VPVPVDKHPLVVTRHPQGLTVTASGEPRQVRERLLMGGPRSDCVATRSPPRPYESDATSGSLLGSSMPSRTRRPLAMTGSSGLDLSEMSLWTAACTRALVAVGETGRIRPIGPSSDGNVGPHRQVGIPFGWTADGANRNGLVLLAPSARGAERTWANRGDRDHLARPAATTLPARESACRGRIR